MWAAFQHRAISRLWLGQALSSIGDEIYRVGLTWMVVGYLGVDTGLLAAGQAAALMTLSLIGGRWADGWEPLRTMIRVDLLRAAIVLCPVLVSLFVAPPLWLLVAVALSLSALSAFFDPALQSTLPHYARDLPLLRAATGLLGTTIRLARLVGPTIVGLLSGIVPLFHFFTLDALSFIASAFSIRSLRGLAPAQEAPPTARRDSFIGGITKGFETIRGDSGMGFAMWSRLLTSGSWSLAISVGFALLAQRYAANDARAFGLLVASYGIGNVAGAVYFGNHARPRPGYLLCTGYLGLGAGFMLVGVAPDMMWARVAAVAAGFAGPMNDLAFTDMMQARFPVGAIPRIFRLRMAVDTGSTLIFTALSPMLFRVAGVRGTIVLCGAVWLMTGLFGLPRITEMEKAAAVPAAD